MTLSSRTRRLFDIITVMALLVALVLYALPVRPAQPDAAAIAPSDAMPSAQSFEAAAASAQQLASYASAASDNAARIVNANILSGTRRAPTSRYVSPDAVPTADFSMPSVFAPSPTASATDAATTDAEVPALYGIVNANGTWRALLKLEESDAGPVLLAEGDRRGSYRVVSIRSNAVVVAGASGQRTLRLPRAASGDSTGKSL